MPVNIFNFQTYNILKNSPSAADDVFKRKRRSLILKSRSLSSFSANISVNKDKKSKEKKLNQTLKKRDPGFISPTTPTSPSLVFNQKVGHSGLSNLHQVPAYAGQFHLTGGFLSRPKEKTPSQKLERELEEITLTLKTIRRELVNLREDGRKVTLEDSTLHGLPSEPVLVISSQAGKKSRGVTPTNSRPNSRSQSRPNSRGPSPAPDKFSQKKLVGKRPNSVQKANDSEKSSGSSNRPKRVGHLRNQTEGFVKHLIEQLHQYQSTKKQAQPLDQFLRALEEKALGRIKKDSFDSDFLGCQPALRNMMKALMVTTSEAGKKFATKKPQMQSRSTQTEEKNPKPISFSNINLSKTMEELIKKVIIESNTTKYTPNTLNDYFEKVCSEQGLQGRRLGDNEKEAMYVAIYSMLQKQLLVEVTLEMIKDSGVNVQNLFQFTFSRIGLDYDQYVQYENHRDQDMSSRPVFEGDLDCTLDDPDRPDKDQYLPDMRNMYPLDFNLIRTSQDAQIEEEVSTKK